MKRLFALILALALFLPLFVYAEQEDTELTEDIDLDEDYSFDEEGNLLLRDDETGETYSLSAISEEDIEKLAAQYELDESIDPNELEINENLPDDVINILLIGLDVRGTKKEKLLTEQGKYSKRSDVLIVLSINMNDGSIKLSSIARNTYVEVPGRKNKTIIANSYGHANYKNGEFVSWTDTPETCIRTVNHNFELNIQYYVAINFYGVAQIIEGLGGVDLDLTKTEATAINTYLSTGTIKNSKGEKISHGKAIANSYDDKNGKRDKLKKTSGVQHLDGIQALMYARLRSIDSDFVRTARTRHLLDCLLKQTLEKIKANKLNVLDLVSDFISYPITNVNPSTIMQLAGKVMSSGVMDNLESTDSLISEFRIPIDGHWKYDTVDGASVTIMKDKQFTVESLHEFIYGKYYPAKAD
ncbi:LCP family protein [Aristaeella hokkaidonensis]|uniref:LCP family protein n=1 Tax=Aristaeella hokkaidonensis TaxID=3046382 RepID=A0AC61MX26_9FIRM|nr:LCP family protein [Aristaeella hokkaidonensis]QUC67430.1 LCP family protein [Aristaeella hokkaidonensis]SNT92462.1 transcriptional attenuator, LytR family [Aristaeella hokkaidonensis]